MIKRILAFTLVELMITILIVSVLATVAMASYRKYVFKAKLAEAYTTIGNMMSKQITYFLENKEFYPLPANPSLVRDNMTIESGLYDPEWLPASVGSQVLFSYATNAGKTDGSGTSLATSTLTGRSFNIATSAGTFLRRTQASTMVDCNPNLAPSTFAGIVTTNNYDWAIVGAAADFSGDGGNLCTAVWENVTAINGVPQKYPILFFRLGQ